MRRSSEQRAQAATPTAEATRRAVGTEKLFTAQPAGVEEAEQPRQQQQSQLKQEQPRPRSLAPEPALQVSESIWMSYAERQSKMSNLIAHVLESLNLLWKKKKERFLCTQ